jgi:hypothetical protein
VVEDFARGGPGGFGFASGFVPGSGGSASSKATGFGNGSSPVRVSAMAEGGEGGFRFSSGRIDARGSNGDATATSRAENVGEVVSSASASAVPGWFGPAFEFDASLGPSGTAHALASAAGATGEVRAEAVSSGFELHALRASSHAAVEGEASADSRASVASTIAQPDLGSEDAFALAAGLPEAADVASALGGNTRVTAAFAGDALDIVLAIGQVGFATANGGAIEARSAQLDIIANVLHVSVSQEVVVGLLGAAFLGSAFDEFRFRAMLRNETLVDVTFDDRDAALAYFDDRVLELGDLGIDGIPGGDQPPPLSLIFDWWGSEPSSGFGVGVIVGLTPIPEPSTWLLASVGLAVLAWARRRRVRL